MRRREPRSPAARISSSRTFGLRAGNAIDDGLVDLRTANPAESGASGRLFGSVVARSDRGERRHHGGIRHRADACSAARRTGLLEPCKAVVNAGSADASPRSASSPRMRIWAASLSLGISAINWLAEPGISPAMAIACSRASLPRRASISTGVAWAPPVMASPRKAAACTVPGS